MNKTSMVRARIEPDLKTDAELVFRQLGLSATQAITLFYKQVVLRGGLPFDIEIPRNTTQKTFDETDAGKNVIVCKDVDDMFRALDI
ncbi:type II toxin-antitoxin system RelB/DinJ family antitoxin [bacterium]|nr:type II toxin-antitoxin system RelB/DinJ family antitoxin [bacterium]